MKILLQGQLFCVEDVMGNLKLFTRNQVVVRQVIYSSTLLPYFS